MSQSRGPGGSREKKRKKKPLKRACDSAPPGLPLGRRVVGAPTTLAYHYPRSARRSILLSPSTTLFALFLCLSASLQLSFSLKLSSPFHLLPGSNPPDFDSRGLQPPPPIVTPHRGQYGRPCTLDTLRPRCLITQDTSSRGNRACYRPPSGRQYPRKKGERKTLPGSKYFLLGSSVSTEPPRPPPPRLCFSCAERGGRDLFPRLGEREGRRNAACETEKAGLVR